MKQTHQLSRNKIKRNGAIFELQKRIDGFFFIREANCFGTRATIFSQQNAISFFPTLQDCLGDAIF